MANHRGSDGTVHVGTDAVAEIRSWSLESTADTIEDSVMGDSARTYQVGLASWSASVDCYWDDDDTAQTALTAGASVSLTLYPEGTAAGGTKYTGTALVTSVSTSSSFDGMLEVSFSATGTGSLTTATI
jgi:hypothetical protein